MTTTVILNESLLPNYVILNHELNFRIFRSNSFETAVLAINYMVLVAEKQLFRQRNTFQEFNFGILMLHKIDILHS